MKKKIVLVLCLLLCVSACFACTDSQYWGVYKEQVSEDSSRTYYLELKSGGKCEYYGLKFSEKKDEVKENKGEYYEGTYKIDGDKITLYMVNHNSINSEPEEMKGTILSNGNINLPWENGASRIFKKQ